MKGIVKYLLQTVSVLLMMLYVASCLQPQDIDIVPDTGRLISTKGTGRLVGSSKHFSTKSGVSELYNAITDKDAIKCWVFVLYDAEGNRVQVIDGYDSDGNPQCCYYPMVHINGEYDSNNPDQNPAVEELEKLGYSFTDLSNNDDGTFYAYVYQDCYPLVRESYKIYSFQNLPGDGESIRKWVLEHFPETIGQTGSPYSSYDDFESCFILDYDDFSCNDEKGMAAFKEYGFMPYSFIYSGFRPDYDSWNDEGYERFFSKCTLRIANHIDDRVCSVDLDNSYIRNTASQYKPFASGASAGVSVYDDLTWQDVLIDSDRGGSVTDSYDTYIFWIPENYAGTQSGSYWSNRKPTEDVKVPTYIETQVTVSNGLFSDDSYAIVRGCPAPISGGSLVMNSYNIERNSNSRLDIDLYYLKPDANSPWHFVSPEHWFIETVFPNKNYLNCSWYDGENFDEANDTGGVLVSSYGCLTLDGYVCKLGDLELTVYLNDVNNGELESFTMSNIRNGYWLDDYVRIHSFVSSSGYSTNDEYQFDFDFSDEVTSDTYIVKFRDPLSGDECWARFKFNYDEPEESAPVVNVNDVYYVGQKVSLSCSKSVTWNLNLPSGCSNYATLSYSGTRSSNEISFYGPVSLSLKVTSSDGTENSYRIQVLEPVLKCSFDDGSTWRDFPNSSNLNFYIDESSKTIRYKYVDENGNPIIFNSSLFNSLLSLSGSTTDGYLFSNSNYDWMSFSHTVGSSTEGTGSLTVSVRRLEYGTHNILEYLNYHYDNRIIIRPPYISSYGMNCQSSLYKNVYVKMIHPLENYLVDSQFDQVNLNIGTVYNDYYNVVSGYYSSSSNYVTLPFEMVVKMKDIDNFEVAFTKDSWSGSYGGYVGNSFTTVSRTNSFLVKDIIAPIGPECGTFYVNMRFTNDNGKTLLLTHHKNGYNNSDLSFPLKLNLYVGLVFERDGSSDDWYMPKFINLRNSDDVVVNSSFKPITSVANSYERSEFNVHKDYMWGNKSALVNFDDYEGINFSAMKRANRNIFQAFKEDITLGLESTGGSDEYISSISGKVYIGGASYGYLNFNGVEIPFNFSTMPENMCTYSVAYFLSSFKRILNFENESYRAIFFKPTSFVHWYNNLSDYNSD